MYAPCMHTVYVWRSGVCAPSTMWGPGLKCRLSGWVAGGLTLWAISLVLTELLGDRAIHRQSDREKTMSLGIHFFFLTVLYPVTALSFPRESHSPHRIKKKKKKWSESKRVLQEGPVILQSPLKIGAESSSPALWFWHDLWPQKYWCRQ